jgi:hypothetical protein
MAIKAEADEWLRLKSARRKDLAVKAELRIVRQDERS